MYKIPTGNTHTPKSKTVERSKIPKELHKFLKTLINLLIGKKSRKEYTTL